MYITPQSLCTDSTLGTEFQYSSLRPPSSGEKLAVHVCQSEERGAEEGGDEETDRPAGGLQLHVLHLHLQRDRGHSQILLRPGRLLLSRPD